MTKLTCLLPALLLTSSLAMAEGDPNVPVYLFDAIVNSADGHVEWTDGADEVRDHLAAYENQASVRGFNEPPCESAFYDRAGDDPNDFGFGGPNDGPDF